MLSLLNSKFEAPSLLDEIPYVELRDRSIVFEDGSLGVAFRVFGIDLETKDSDQINDLTLRLRNFLNSLPSGLHLQLLYALDTDLEEKISDHAIVSEKASSLIKNLCEKRMESIQEKVKSGLLISPKIYLFLRWGAGIGKIGSLSFFSSESQWEEKVALRYQETLAELENIASNIFGNLTQCGFSLKRLKDEEIKVFLYNFFNPDRKEELSLEKEKGHESGKFLVSQCLKEPLASKIALSPLSQSKGVIYLDGYFHRILTLCSLPEFTESLFIERLLPHLPARSFLSLNLFVPDQEKEISKLKQKRRIAFVSSLKKEAEVSDLESEAKLETTEELLRELLETGQKIFYTGITIVIRHKDEAELERLSRYLLSSFRELNGAEAISETFAAYPALKTVFPGAYGEILRKKRIKTDNLADFLPLFEPESGSQKPVCLFENRFGGIVALDPFADELPNFSSLVTGSSGAGKSFYFQNILMQLLRENPFIAILDIGGSYRRLVEVCGGEHVEVSPSEKFAINPFELSEEEKEPSGRKIKFLTALFELLFRDEEKTALSKLEKNLLEQAIFETYKKYPRPRLSHFRDVLEHSPEEILRNFSKMLYSWTGDRPYGKILDRESEITLKSNLTCFDFVGLHSYPDLQEILVLIFINFILEKMEKITGKTKRIVMDEMWDFLKSKATVDFMEFCVRTSRKQGAGIDFITQGIEEILKSPISSAILNNTATKVFLLQRGDLDVIKNTLKLNDSEIELIRSLSQRKGHFSEAFVIHGDRRFVARLSPLPQEYWMATTDARDKELLEKLQKENPGISSGEIIQKLSKDNPFGNRD